jgi:hypothetical protein
MSTAWRQHGLKFRHRQQGLKEIEGYDWVLIFSWLGAPVLGGVTCWAAFRLLCCMAQLLLYVPGSLK